MKKWKWLTVPAALGVVGIVLWGTSVFAQGPQKSPAPETSVQTDGDWGYMGSLCFGPSGMMSGTGMMGGFYMMGLADPVTLNRVADTLGLTSDQLTAQLTQGKTIAQVAQAQNVDTSKVVTTILAPESDILQVRVNYGYLSDTQAQSILDQAKLSVEQAITTPFYGTRTLPSAPNSGYTPGYGRGMMGGRTAAGRGIMGGGMMGW